MKLLKKEEYFLYITEILYVIILACGIGQLLMGLPQKLIFQPYTCLMGLGIVFVLIRFYFAPSKNIRVLLEQPQQNKLIVLLFDYTLLMIHAFLFFRMCQFFNSNMFLYYSSFVFLLMWNVIWLVSIKIRITKPSRYIGVWIYNNGLHLIFILVCLLFFPNKWFLLFFLYTNSLIDIFITHTEYI
jgi:hypothetical protein